MTNQTKIFCSIIVAVLMTANSYGQQCIDNLTNEDESIVLPSGTMALGVDNVAGTASDTNASSCALVVENSDTGQPWGSYRIAIDLASYGIVAGDELFMAVDGKSLTGQARLEITPNNTPNNSLGAHSFGSSWEHYETTFSVPSNLTTIDLWFFSNYAQQTAGNAVYDNLVVRKVNDEVLDFSNAFVTTWKTDNPGVSANNQITIPTITGGEFNGLGWSPDSFNYAVDWGDGSIESGFTGDATHTYAVPGTYTVSIIGDFPHIYFNGSGDKDKILSIEQWGDIRWISMVSAFEGCSNLDVVALDVPSPAQDYRAMFKDCKSLVGNSKFNDWDMHDAFGVAYMFAGAELFNQDISNWSFATLFNMNSMFEGASSFNHPVSWGHFGRTPTMINMFKDATSFDQDLSLMPRYGSDMTGMLVNSGMSNENYDKTLIGWGSNPKESDVVFDAPQNQYCLSKEARHTLIQEYGWIINDGGNACPNSACPTTTVELNTQQQVDDFASTYDIANCHFEGGITIRGTVTNLDGLSGLTELWGDLRILSSSVVNVDGLSSLTKVEGDLVIYNNRQLENLDGLTSLTEVLGEFYIRHNSQLNNIGGLSSLNYVGVVLDISYNEALTDIQGLASVRRIGDLDITNNAVLSNCAIDAICDPSIVRGHSSIYGNAGNCLNLGIAEASCSSSACPNDLPNEDASIVLPSGTVALGVDNVAGTAIDTNGSPCALMVENTDVGQPWGSYRIAIDLASYGIVAGDELFMAVDGKSLTGQARLEITPNNTPNNSLGAHSFGSSWEHYETTFSVPSNLSTIDLWFFSNYAEQNAGNAVYDNLVVRKVNDEVLDFSNAFVTTWKTDNPGDSTNNQITIPTSGIGSYNFSVDWGDGTIESGFTGDATHTYSNIGTYTVSIIGEFPNIYFNEAGDKDKILTVENWGNIVWQDFSNVFKGCTNLDVIATDIPNTANVFSYTAMFQDCKSLIGNYSFHNWDVGNSLGMAYMFAGAELFNQDISNWHLGTTMHMDSMFEGASSFNQPLSFEGMERTPTMVNMLKGATSFDQDLSLMPRYGSDMTGMLVNSGMSNENYDKTLIGWASNPRESDVVLDAPQNHYCLSEEARQKLINDFGWTINDAGKGCVTTCPNDLPNENASIVLPSGTVALGVDNVTGTAVDTNGSGCALEVSNVDSGQPWGAYRIAIQLSDYGINEGDQLFISVDGKSVTGTARVEINPNNTPNNSLGSRTFTNVWSTYETTFAVPVGLTTIDLWFFSNYAQQNAGYALYDNLEVINLSSGNSGKSYTETKSENSLAIYPNPATIETTFNFTKPTTVGTIQIFDVTGRLVRTIKGGEIDTDGTPVNVQEMPVGTYFVKTRDISGVEFQQQMLIQRQ